MKTRTGKEKLGAIGCGIYMIYNFLPLSLYSILRFRIPLSVFTYEVIIFRILKISSQKAVFSMQRDNPGN
jgi:hypothetical protein